MYNNYATPKDTSWRKRFSEKSSQNNLIGTEKNSTYDQFNQMIRQLWTH